MNLFLSFKKHILTIIIIPPLSLSQSSLSLLLLFYYYHHHTLLLSPLSLQSPHRYCNHYHYHLHHFISIVVVVTITTSPPLLSSLSHHHHHTVVATIMSLSLSLSLFHPTTTHNFKNRTGDWLSQDIGSLSQCRMSGSLVDPHDPIFIK